MLSQYHHVLPDAFKKRHGRPLRVLHIGNIANNAYNNAKFLRSVGVECDVLCYDYYHCMACPEWEDADFAGVIENQFKPDWTKVDLKGFARPRWFVQGPLAQCIAYLNAKCTDQSSQAEKLWNYLACINGTGAHSESIEMQAKKNRSIFLPALFSLRSFIRKGVWKRMPDRIGKRLPDTWYGQLAAKLLSPFVWVAMLPFRILLSIPISLFLFLKYFDTFIARKNIIRTFRDVFPERKDQLRFSELFPYNHMAILLSTIVNYYDIIQAYATDPLIPCLGDLHPYIAYEHGTLRDFTQDDNVVCRLTSLAYNQADHCFITNGDCLEYAKKIKVTRFSPMIHPIDDLKIRSISDRYDELHAEYGCDYLFLCPLRHDWEVKGTDQYIRALPVLREVLGDRFKVIFTKWGQQLDESVMLAESLGCSHLIDWREPFGKYELARMQKSTDIVFDQLKLPHFGATAPEAIALGVPVIMSYEPESTRWIIPEPAPILSAKNQNEIITCVKMAIDPQWISQYKIKAKKWFDRYHASSVLVNHHLDAYARVLNSAHERRPHEAL